MILLGRTFRGHIERYLEMKSCVSDTELSYKKLGSTLEGMCATFVDDTIHEGSKGYQTLTKKTGERFM